MREEIRRVHEETALTSIYVTHDQKEALSLADRMALMHGGQIAQLGTPQEIYQRPKNRFIANFLGDANLIEATVTGMETGRVIVQSSVGRLEGVPTTDRLRVGGPVVCCIRPESITLGEPGSSELNRFGAQIEREVFLGETRHVHLRAGDCKLMCYRLAAGGNGLAPGNYVDCAVAREDIVVLPPD
jgi:ABC-type Fe3+/spermidine/putrescine transport system ATPase subunit